MNLIPRITLFCLSLFIASWFILGCATIPPRVYELDDINLTVVVSDSPGYLKKCCGSAPGCRVQGCWDSRNRVLYTKPDFETFLHELRHAGGEHHYGKLNFND